MTDRKGVGSLRALFLGRRRQRSRLHHDGFDCSTRLSGRCFLRCQPTLTDTRQPPHYAQEMNYSAPTVC